MSEENFNDAVLDMETLTGRKVRVINPESGADINCKQHFAGKNFVLKRGDFKDVDEAIAKSAAYIWQFLKITDIPANEERVELLKDMPFEDKVQEINSIDEDYDYPTVFDINAKFLIDRYAYHICQLIAKGLGIKGYQSMKKDTLYIRILERTMEEIVGVCEQLQIPFYVI